METTFPEKLLQEPPQGEGSELQEAQGEGLELQEGGLELHEAQGEGLELQEGGLELHEAQGEGLELHEAQEGGLELHEAQEGGLELHEAQEGSLELHVAQGEDSDLQEALEIQDNPEASGEDLVPTNTLSINGDVPSSERDDQPDLFHRLEAAFEDNVESQAKLQRLTHMISAISAPKTDTPHLESSSGHFGDDIVAKAGDLDQDGYQEAVQPMDIEPGSVNNIHVVGEILPEGELPGTNLPKGGRESSSSELEKDGTQVVADLQHNGGVPERGEDVVEKSEETPKRPKRQLAASFGSTMDT